MSYHVTKRMTPARLAWLRALHAAPQRRRPRGRTGFDCHCIGWTTWTPAGEVLTFAGLAALQAHDDPPPPPFDDDPILGAVHD